MGRETLFAMPSSSVLLLFSVAFGLAGAIPWAEAQKTAVYTPHEWSPRPTGIPQNPASLFKRDDDYIGVEVCGWLGGDKAKAVTCGGGSSCVHDTVHGLVGCCTTDGPCTEGVYTTCQDQNSPGWGPSATIANNGVLTCSSSSACYQNTYPGPYSQWACGDSTQGASLVTSYAGQPTDVHIQIVYTGVSFSPMPAKPSASTSNGILVAPSSQPTSGGSNTGTPAALGKVAPSMDGSSSTSNPAPASKSNTGAVAGGTVAAVAGVAMIAAVAFWLLRRRQRLAKDRRATSFRSRTISPPVLQGHSFSSQPFQPVRSESPEQPEHWVSPMTGHPNNAPNSRSIFPPPSETAYHGSGGAGGLVNIEGDDDSSNHSTHHSSPRSQTRGFNDASPQLPQGRTLTDRRSPPPIPEYSPPPPSQFPQFSPPRPPSQFPDLETPSSARAQYAQLPLHHVRDSSDVSQPTQSQYAQLQPQQFHDPQEQEVPLVSEIDDFSRNWHQSVVAPQHIEHDTHIHDGNYAETPVTYGVGVPLRKAVPTIREQGRVVDREARSEALREVGRSDNVRMEGWSPRRLQTVRQQAEEAASGRSSPSNSYRSGEDKEMELPAKSPLRQYPQQQQRLSYGLISNAVGGVTPGGSRQRYQLVDEVVGNRSEVPVLHSPGVLRNQRSRKNTLN